MSYEEVKKAINQLNEIKLEKEELQHEKEIIIRRRSAKLGERANINATHQEVSI